MLVKLSDAAWLVGRHERVVRRRLLLAEGERGRLEAVKRGQVWMIDTADLARLWSIDQTRLDELQRRHRSTPDVLAAKVEALERKVARLQERIDQLEGSERHQARYDAILGDGSLPPSPVATYAPVSHPSASYVAPPAIRMRHTSMGDVGAFDNRAEAARWLVRHGIASEGTPKSWSGWKDVTLEPRAVLDLAMSLQDPHNHRITWRLHPCGDEGCVCHELLTVEG